MTFCVLEQFPEELHNRLIEIWKEGVWKDQIEAHPDTFYHFHLAKDHEIFKEFPFARTIEYYMNTPGSNSGPHLDRGRWCAINVPIDVNTEKSCFLIGKHFNLTKYRRKTHLDKPDNDANAYFHKVSEEGPTGFYYEDDGLFDYYNLEKPVIFCTKVPHGYHNDECETERVLVSITFDKKWEEMLHIIPQDWY